MRVSLALACTVLFASCATVPPFETLATDALIETTVEAVYVIAVEANTIEGVVSEVELTMTVTPEQVQAIKKATSAIKAAAVGLQAETLPALIESHEADNERATDIVEELAVIKAAVRPLWKWLGIAAGIIVALVAALAIVLKIR